MDSERKVTKLSEPSMQLASSRTIKYLFAKFHARYGSRWASQFPEDLWPLVQSEWLSELSWCSADDIRRGLEVWRDKWPPNVFEFSDACRPVKDNACLGYKEHVSIAPINTSPEDAENNIKTLQKAIAGTGVLKTGENFGKSIIQDEDYLEAQDKLNAVMREAVDNLAISEK